MSRHYIGAIAIGVVVFMPHPKKPDHFVLPGGRIANRLDAEAAAKRLNHQLTGNTTRK